MKGIQDVAWAVAIDAIIFPMNNIALFCAKAIINHPEATIGATKSIIFFLPSFPDKIPPKGEQITPERVRIAANPDPSFSVNFNASFDSLCS